MRTIIITLTAGEPLPVYVGGNYFHLLETVQAVDVEFLRNQGIFATARAMEAGFFSRPADGFEGLVLTSATTQAVKVVVGSGDGGYNRTTGSVQIIGQADAFAQAQATVTNASGQLLAANASRKLLIIQNNDLAGNIFVNFAGAAATTANGIKIEPGGSITLDTHLPSAAVFAIGDIASNANIVVIES